MTRFPKEPVYEELTGVKIKFSLPVALILMTLAVLVTFIVFMGASQPTPVNTCAETTVVCEMTDKIDALRFEVEILHLQLERLDSILSYADKYDVDARTSAVLFDAALAEGLDVDLAFNLARVESGFRPRAVSHAGAVGIVQVMPATAYELDHTVTRAQLFDPHVNARLGFRYLRQMLARYDGDLDRALLAYNRGPARVAFLVRRGRDPDNGYPALVCQGPCD